MFVYSDSTRVSSLLDDYTEENTVCLRDAKLITLLLLFVIPLFVIIVYFLSFISRSSTHDR